jgi:hypothetical protein
MSINNSISTLEMYYYIKCLIVHLVLDVKNLVISNEIQNFYSNRMTHKQLKEVSRQDSYLQIFYIIIYDISYQT